MTLSIALAGLLVPIASPTWSAADEDGNDTPTVSASAADSSSDTSTDASSESSTESSSESTASSAPEYATGTLESSTTADGFSAAYTIDETAGIPQGSKLVATDVSADSGAYDSARDAVAEALGKSASDENLQVAVVEVQVEDADGNQVDPKAEALLKLELADLPAAAQVGTVKFHLVKDSRAKTLAEVPDENAPPADDVATATASGGKASAAFEVEALGTFAVSYETESAQSAADAAETGENAGSSSERSDSSESPASTGDAVDSAEATTSDSSTPPSNEKSENADDTAADPADEASTSEDFVGPVLTPEPLTASSDDGTFAAEVSYDETAGIPEGARLAIETLQEASDEYVTVSGAIARTRAGESAAQEFQLKAAVLRIVDADGNEVTPTGAVRAKLSVNGVPDGAQADSLQLHRIADGAVTCLATAGESGGIVLADGTATAEFETTAFGTYAFSWQAANAVNAGIGADEETSAEDATTLEAEGSSESSESSAIDDSDESDESGEAKDAEFTGPVIDAQSQLLTASAQTGDGSTTVTAQVSYGAAAQIPEGAKLAVSELAEDSDGYAAAKSAVGEDRELIALDIHLEDAGGAQVEPQASVSVKLTATGLPEDAAEDSVQIVHVKADGTVETVATATTSDASVDIAAAKPMRAPATASASTAGTGTVAVENGTLTAEFETDGFSTFAIGYELMSNSNSSTAYTVEVGKSITITGTTPTGTTKTNAWSSSDSGIATVTGSDVTVTVTGVSEGTVTITHDYYYYKNNGHKNESTSESFTVQVTKSSTTITDEEATAQSFASSDPTVTVKDTGNLKKLSGYHVVVEDANREWNSETNFLKAYHIYLADENNKEVSASDLMNGTLNLQVTLTYSTLPDWFSKAKSIKHYNNATSKSEQFISDVKFGSSAKTISFMVHGFSSFVIMSSGASSSGESESGGESTTTPNDADNKWAAKSATGTGSPAANHWQVVSEDYNGTHSVAHSSDDTIRVSKSVEATGTEDEFNVHLSIDEKREDVAETDYMSYFKTLTWKAVTNNSEHEWVLGNIYDSIVDSNTVTVSASDSSTYGMNDYKATICAPDGTTVLASNVHLSWDHSNNMTIYSEITVGSITKYLACGVSVKSGDSNTVILSNDAYSWIKQAVATTTKPGTPPTLTSVTDVMGTDVVYVDNSASTGNGTASYEKDKTTLSWTPGSIDSPSPTYGSATVVEEKSGSTVTKVTVTTPAYFFNVASLTYKVRLNTQASSFSSAYNNSPATAYYTNGSATLNYTYNDTDRSVEFPKPSVKGNLYDLKLLKIDDSTNKALTGAEFTVTRTQGTYSQAADSSQTSNSTNSWVWNSSATTTATSGSDGYITLTGLPWGTYEIQETKAPDGYTKSSTKKIVQLGQVLSASTLTASTVTSGANHAMSNRSLNATDKSNDNALVISNSPAISLPETGGEGSPRWMILAGIVIGGATVAYAIYVGVRDPRRKRGTVRGGGRRG